MKDLEMIKRFKDLFKGLIQRFVKVSSKNKIGRYFIGQVLNTAMSFRREITHRGVRLSFVAPNGLNHFRIDSFSTKEPETLDWIDNIPLGSVLWDIGANIGLYSCYAARSRNCQVIAFEPSVFNLELL